MSAKDRQDLWDAHRQRPFHMITALITSVGVLFGVAFTAFGLIYTARALQTTQQGQLTDRYTTAVEQLASPAAEVRLGGIFALQRLAVDSPGDRVTVRNVLAAFVRHHDFCVAQPPAEQCTAAIRDLCLARTAMPMRPDIDAALTTALTLSTAGDDLADFSQTRLPRVYFPTGARVQRADLEGADLVFAGISGANLASSNLSGSCLTHANLTGADLTSANLTGADLRHADLRTVSGMTPDEIRAVAVTDSSTRFGALEHRTEHVLCGPQTSLGIMLHAPAN